MCRWLVYSGSPTRVEDILFKPQHSLIDQSLNSKMGDTTTNGDGFGLGWYGNDSEPALFRSIGPAWNDRNLLNLSKHIESRLIFAHIRAATGTAIQQTNCHPFQYENWLWMHNGFIAHFRRVKRDLAMAVDSSLYAEIEGSTDSELFFYLALTFGLQDDGPAAVERAVGFIERTGRANGIVHPIQMTVATTDGQKVYSFRYSSEGQSRSLFYSTDVDALRVHYPHEEVFQKMSPETRIVVSEPLSDLEGAWNEMPESTFGIIQEGEDEIHPFVPRDDA